MPLESFLFSNRTPLASLRAHSVPSTPVHSNTFARRTRIARIAHQSFKGAMENFERGEGAREYKGGGGGERPAARAGASAARRRARPDGDVGRAAAAFAGGSLVPERARDTFAFFFKPVPPPADTRLNHV